MEKTRKSYLIGNWKMHGSIAQLDQFFSDCQQLSAILERVSPILCPPFPYLMHARQYLQKSGFQLGAQEVSAYQSGAYTAQVSASMLAECGCDYVIIGHSECREALHLSNEAVAEKAWAAKQADLTPIICVGESKAQRDADQTEAVVRAQCVALLETYGVALLSRALFAYEPVWAIGTGRSATPQEAQKIHAFLRAVIATYDPILAERIPLLYGGSVKPENAKNLLEQPDIDGFLVGGASLKAPDFLAIAQCF